VKRFLIRALVISVVPLLIYGAVGWSSQGGRLFAPVRTVRSLFDADVDASTRWRDWENYDLVSTYAQKPGVRLGVRTFVQRGHQAARRHQGLRARAYIPHNSVLGLWAFGGLIGFALLWAVYPVGMFFTVRAYGGRARRPSGLRRWRRRSCRSAT